MGVKGTLKKTHDNNGGVFRSLSRKADMRNLLGDICGVLDLQDMEIVVVREKKCAVEFSNARAHARMQTDEGYTGCCKTGYAGQFPGICGYCPYGMVQGEKEHEAFEIRDTDDRVYSAKCNTISWIDGKPAAILMLRDITDDVKLKNKLYELAYTDQLTGVPNRQRLKDDFSAMEERIGNNELCGIVALFDLDHFKTVNDTYGHNTGDIVLRRLTEHMQGESAFSGHLYRLGGDEFVLLYSDPPDTYGSHEELVNHYRGVLANALLAYTLPNIDVKCTISIGVSVFPRHGTNLSEVLRKADISLYQAKESGRNRIIFFSEKYDKAQKFKDLFIIIQPILLRDGKTFGYELIDKGNGEKLGDATVSLNEFNRTLDALGLNELEDELYYFITYSRQLLTPAVIRNLPRDKFIVQVDVSYKTPRDELASNFQTCKELRENGYKLALNGVHSGHPMPEILTLADFCKFSPEDRNLVRQKCVIAANSQIKFIATKVDTYEGFIKAQATGFHLFQGYHFSQPVLGRKTKEISPLKLNYLRLLKLSSADDYMDFREISTIISSDVALSYKLLRILNSAAVGLRNVSSISSAVAYLGEESLKKWIAVLALRGIAEDKPLELVRMSLVRARFGELLAPHFRIKSNPQQVFMVGMLSLLHIAVEKTREQLLEEIPVADDIRDSLLTKTGIYSDLLRFFENYEYSNWELVSQFIEELQISASFVNDAYISSVRWCNDLES